MISATVSWTSCDSPLSKSMRFQYQALIERHAGLTCRLRLLWHALPSPLLLLYICEALVLVPVLDLEVARHAVELGDGELVGVVARHGGATETGAEVFCARAHRRWVEGCLEDLAPQAGKRGESGRCDGGHGASWG